MEKLKISSFSKRLQMLLGEKNITQSDLSRMTGIRASSISDWLNEKYEAKQDKIDLIASYFNISPAWLMGYDVDMKNNFFMNTLSPEEQDLLDNYNNSNTTGKTIILDTSKNIAKAYPKPNRQEMIDYLRELPRAAYGGAKNVFSLSDEELETEYNQIREELEDD